MKAGRRAGRPPSPSMPRAVTSRYWSAGWPATARSWCSSCA